MTRFVSCSSGMIDWLAAHLMEDQKGYERFKGDSSMIDALLPPMQTRLRRYGWILVVVWTGIVVASTAWNATQVWKATLEEARAQARVAYEKDLIYRRWSAAYGGVYVPVSEGTEPNPYLAGIPERDITTLSGRELTLVNPAYMTRQVHDLAEDAYGVRGHITSLDPIRQENAADAWEIEALVSFEQGETEISGIEQMDNGEYMRLMRPLVTEASCLKCHAEQGYQEGDIRGGISVSIPMKPLRFSAGRSVMSLSIGHGVLWFVGLVGTALALQSLRRSESERVRAEEKIRHMALHDALTDLPNRVLFTDRLNQAMAHARRFRQTMAVMLLDLDNLKDVNDSLGHNVGDLLLQATAERLTSLVRESDTIARIGGDEFVMILPDLAEAREAELVAEKVLGVLRETFVVEGEALQVTTSVGIAMYPGDGEDVSSLLKHADIAMYRAKKSGRDHYQRY